eukprot:Rhum_TRINITY_DN8120_c0_g1::Rhum_TRINITY_DN8120_c0_g1_i1::g.26408::m.26408
MANDRDGVLTDEAASSQGTPNRALVNDRTMNYSFPTATSSGCVTPFWDGLESCRSEALAGQEEVSDLCSERMASLRRQRRVGSMPAIIQSGSITMGQQQHLKGVTPYHSREEIASALEQTRSLAQCRLSGLASESEATGHRPSEAALSPDLFPRRYSLPASSHAAASRPSPDAPLPPRPLRTPERTPESRLAPTPDMPPKDLGQDLGLAHTTSATTIPQSTPDLSPTDLMLPPTNSASGSPEAATQQGYAEAAEDVAILQLELQDREEQIMQAVELGAGLLSQMERERGEAGEREAALQKRIDQLNAEGAKMQSLVTKQKTTLMYLLDVEEELVNSRIENIVIQKELETAARRGREHETTAWLQQSLVQDQEHLHGLIKEQADAEKEVKLKLKELNMWKARSARCGRLAAEIDEGKEREANLEREGRRLTKLARDKDATIYGLKSEIKKFCNDWRLQSTEQAVSRLKLEILRNQQEAETLRAAVAAARQEAAHYRTVAHTSGFSHEALEEQRALIQALQNEGMEQLGATVAAAKEDLYAEMSLWMQAVADCAADNRRQGEALRRMRADNAALKGKVRDNELKEQELSRDQARARLVNSSQCLSRELAHLRDYARAMKGQASVRHITEKECVELSSGLGNLYKLYVSFLSALLTPAEKQQIGVSLADPMGTVSIVTCESPAPSSRASPPTTRKKSHMRSKLF